MLAVHRWIPAAMYNEMRRTAWLQWAHSWSTAAAFNPLQPNLPANLPKPKKSETAIKTAAFVKSSVAMDHMPPEVGPEFVLIGHSNVGKSSLLNLITGSTDLAKVSKRPGRTTCINHFLINQRYYLVDCPGYGHARVSKTERVQWHAMTKAYFLERRTLAHVFLLIDSTQPPQRMDVDAALWLSEHQIPYSLIFTKVDLSSHGNTSNQTSGSARDAGNKGAVSSRQGSQEIHESWDGGHSDLASIIPTFCNAVQALEARQQHNMDLWRRRQQKRQTIVEETITAACVRYSTALKELQGGRGPPFYICTSAVTGLGRRELLTYMAQLKQLFAMPVLFRK